MLINIIFSIITTVQKSCIKDNDIYLDQIVSRKLFVVIWEMGNKDNMKKILFHPL